MTMPNERTRAVIKAQAFLRDLLDPKKTPKVPKAIRKEAYWVLRHFPHAFEMKMVANKSDREVFGPLADDEYEYYNDYFGFPRRKKKDE